MPDTPELPPTDLPPLPAYVARNDYRRENYYTADQMREYVLADRATRLAAAPQGWKPESKE